MRDWLVQQRIKFKMVGGRKSHLVTNWEIQRKMKYEEELDPQFAQDVVKKLGSDNLFGCIQCGTCSATCPVSHHMDYSPRRIIAMTRAGFKDEVMRSFTIWLCASCYSCTVGCPKEIKITELMYTLKQKAIEEKVYPSRFPIPVLAREFARTVRNFGRNHEGLLLLRMFLKTNPFKLFTMSGLGSKLFFKGRLEIMPHTIKGKQQLLNILHAVENGNGNGNHGQ
ncbi:MAG: 4Fe-4S dicluster domain-containing protein [Candidatus Omnitrophota bacterium]